MEIKNPFNKRKKVPQLQLTKEKPKQTKKKKDWFGASLIVYTGTMIGALVVYLLVTFT